MPGYQTLSMSAKGLRTDESTLADFLRKGWIEAVERRNVFFLAADQRYRAKYVLHLAQTKHLNDEQIQLVLSVQRPPYSLAAVDDILSQRVKPSDSDDAAD